MKDSQQSQKERTLNKDLDERTNLIAKTNRGELISINQEEHTKMQRLMAKGSKRVTKNMLNTKIMTI